MKPPRYLLREYMVNRILKKTIPGYFLEIGHGAGDMLENLAHLGFSGQAYDYSPQAKKCAAELIETKKLVDISLIDQLPRQAAYDFIFFFEVIGYWLDPLQELNHLRDLLAPDGKMIFSFTNIKHGGIAEKNTGNMRCFSRNEVIELLHQSQFDVELIWNYGFPLSNLLRPLLHLMHRKKSNSVSQIHAIQESGLGGRSAIFRVINSLLWITIILPFSWIQIPFKRSDLGTGYIVQAKKR